MLSQTPIAATRFPARSMSFPALSCTLFSRQRNGRARWLRGAGARVLLSRWARPSDGTAVSAMGQRSVVHDLVANQTLDTNSPAKPASFADPTDGHGHYLVPSTDFDDLF